MQYVEVTYFLSGLVGDVKQQQQLYTSSLVDEILFPEVQYTYYAVIHVFISTIKL